MGANPFIYGRSVSPEEFVGRSPQIRTIFLRIGNGESTAIVGEPHIGKTSLLRYIASERVRAEWLGSECERFVMSYIDPQLFTSKTSARNFWEEAIHSLPEEVRISGKVYPHLVKNEYGFFTLSRFFDDLASNGVRLVLLIDEFDSFIHHPNLGTAEFFSGLRSLSSLSKGLVLVTASISSLSEMNRQTARLNLFGSPFFNVFVQVQLQPFSEKEVDILLERALFSSKVTFGEEDRRFISYLSGRHPYLVQVAAATLFEVKLAQDIQGFADYYQMAAHIFRRTAETHFSDFWNYLDVDSQQMLTTLTLGELVGRKEGRVVDLESLESSSGVKLALIGSASRGLIQSEQGNEFAPPVFVRFENQRWQVQSIGLLWWIADNILSNRSELNSVILDVAESLVIESVREFRSVNSLVARWKSVNITWLDQDQFIQGLRGIADWMCTTIGLPDRLQQSDPVIIGNLYAFVLDVSSVFEGTQIPSKIPLIFLRGNKLFDEDIQDLRHLLSDKILSSWRIALLVVLSRSVEGDSVQDTLGKLQQTYAYDVIPLGLEELKRISAARNRRRMLRRLVLTKVDLTSISPFVVNGPTSGKVFFGRERELREIAEHIGSASFAVIGGRRFGKSSVLLRLQRVRLPAAGFCVIYHDCATTPTYDDFFAAAIRDWRPEPPSDAPDTFGDLLHSPPSDKPFILLLDEADKPVPTDRASGWPLFNALRALANSRRSQVVLSGERTLRDALRDPKSPLFNFANEMLLGPLDFRAVEELVTRPMKQLEIELVDEKAIVNRIWAFTSGHPNIVQRLCRRLIERLNELGMRRITLDDVDAVIEDPGFQREDFLSTYWEAATSLEKIISLLMAEDENVRTLRAVRQALAERSDLRPKAREVDDALQRLVDLRSILKRAPTGYEFAVEAFPRVVAGTMTLDDMLEILIEEYQEQGE